MYKPKFNHVLVEIIESVEAQYGKTSDENLGGEVYREGKLIEVGEFIATQEYPISVTQLQEKLVDPLVGKQIMWNEGHEAGTVFEHDNKKYALIYWWDIIGVKDGE